MDQNSQISSKIHNSRGNVLFGFRELLHKLLSYANLEYSRLEFLRRISSSILIFSGADMLSIRIDEDDKITRCRAIYDEHGDVRTELLLPDSASTGSEAGELEIDPIPGPILKAIDTGNIAAPSNFLTRSGSFWIGDTARPILLHSTDADGTDRTIIIAGEFLSLALVVVPISAKSRGYLFLSSRRRDFFSKEDIRLYETIAETLGAALAHQKAQWALRERNKEMTCLYGIANIAGRPGIPLEELLSEIVHLLPPAWQYPEITRARITFDDRSYVSADFKEGPDRQIAPVMIDGRERGKVEVIYTSKQPIFEEGPFLKEERTLINEIGRQVGIIVEHWETESEKSRLEEQLRYADRLATIGRLSAGMAHELNEPLAAILGFAQLIRSSRGLPPLAAQDAEKIVHSALSAREVIKNLMIFTQQMPSQKSFVDLSRLVRDSLPLLESRCFAENIVIKKNLAEELPAVWADPSQLNQVLINLSVNAIQAMPRGGELTISTGAEGRFVYLIVDDTGIGIPQDILNQLFIPFFTTRDVGRGKGLGLSVVHGIVTGHGGTIEVKSEVGKGSSFIVRLPITGGEPG